MVKLLDDYDGALCVKLDVTFHSVFTPDALRLRHHRPVMGVTLDPCTRLMEQTASQPMYLRNIKQPIKTTIHTVQDLI